MISSKKYIDWIRDIIETDLSLIAIGYNPSNKKHIIEQEKFDMENPIIETKLFSKILSKILEEYVGKKYKVRLIDTKYSFLPKFFPKSNPDVILMKSYLDKISWKRKKYFGVFTIKDIFEFFKIFINYSLNYSYQDILLFSLEKDIIIQISHYGELWLSSPSKEMLNNIGKELDKEGATIIYSYKKVV